MQQVLDLMQMHPKERLGRVSLTASWFNNINMGYRFHHYCVSKLLLQCYVYLRRKSWYTWLRYIITYGTSALTHWGRVTYICVSELTTIGSDNGLAPGRRQAIIWNNAGLLLIEPLGTNFSEISVGIQTFSFKKMHLNMSSAKWRPFCLGLNVITADTDVWMQ